MKIIESIKFTGANLNDIFKLECVDGIIKDHQDEPSVILKVCYTYGRVESTRATTSVSSPTACGRYSGRKHI